MEKTCISRHISRSGCHCLTLRSIIMDHMDRMRAAYEALRRTGHFDLYPGVTHLSVDALGSEQGQKRNINLGWTLFDGEDMHAPYSAPDDPVWCEVLMPATKGAIKLVVRNNTGMYDVAVLNMDGSTAVTVKHAADALMAALFGKKLGGAVMMFECVEVYPESRVIMFDFSS